MLGGSEQRATLALIKMRSGIWSREETQEEEIQRLEAEQAELVQASACMPYELTWRGVDACETQATFLISTSRARPGQTGLFCLCAAQEGRG